jgi:hypothetical protein
MQRKTKQDAREQLKAHGVPLDQNFFGLSFDMKERILAAAKAHGYRASKSANGSTARCFYEYANR